MTAKGPYSRVYHSIVDDPMFQRVFENDHALAQWLRMLLIADAMWPTSAPMPARNPTVRLLIDCGLVVHRPGNRYSIRGLDAERERRSDAARYAAGVRWQSTRNADALPRRDETRIDEKTDGQSPPQVFMGFKHRWRPNLKDIERQHEESRRQAAELRQKREQASAQDASEGSGK